MDLQQHSDLLWVVQEAFNAPLPLSWTEYTDDEGRVYFFNQDRWSRVNPWGDDEPGMMG